MAWLKILEGARPGLTYEIKDSPITAGRDPSNHIHLSDQVASRQHMRVAFVDGAYVVSDLASKNGTHLNGEAIRARATLADGDEIRVGSHVFLFELDGAPDYRDASLPSGWLRVLEGPATGATFHLGERTCTVGRDPGNLIQLVDEDLSRRHAQFRWSGDHYALRDLNSTNGTAVNGHPIREVRLNHGDRVRLGSHLLLFEMVATANYRDHSLAAKDVRRHLRADDTHVVDVESLDIDIDIDVESLDIDIDIDEDSLVALALEPALSPEVVTRRIEAQVHSPTGLDEFWNRGLDELCALLEPDRGMIVAFEGARLLVRGLWVEGKVELRAVPASISRPAIERARRERVSVREHGLLATRDSEPSQPSDRVSALVCTPIRTPQQDFGLLYFDRLGPAAREFDDAEFELIRVVARLLAEGVVARQRRAGGRG